MNTFANNPRRFNEILAEVIAEIGGDEAVQDLIRKEKATLIEDIMRVYKLLQCFNPKVRECMKDVVSTFDTLYELDLDTLEAHLKGASKQLDDKMKARVIDYNNGLFPPLEFGF